MQMKTRLRKRIKSDRGFTMAELMLTMLILVMVAGVLTAGVSVASKAYRKVVESANAQLLYSTTLTALRTELGSAKAEITCSSDKTVTYFSTETGYTAIVCGSEGVVFKPYLQNNGNGTFSEPKDDAEKALYSRPLVSTAAADGLVVQYDSITYDGTKKLFTIQGLRVIRAGEDADAEPLAGSKDEKSTFTIRAVNAQTEAE
jgi:prepilin-type N-terminal cleavage/methylation domain-containing protein